MTGSHFPRASEVPLNRILAPTDFSVNAERAVQWAIMLSRAFQAELILLHVIDPDVTAGAPPSIPAAPSVERDVLERVRLEVTDLLSRIATECPRARAVVREGAPRAIILDTASELDVQLIVIGSHGRTGLAHIMFGSIADYILQHSRIPVLTVPHAERRSLHSHDAGTPQDTRP